MDYQRLCTDILKEVGGIDYAVDQLIDRYKTPNTVGVILSGIPGCGKTKLATTFVQHCTCPYTIKHCSELFFADQGKSEAALIECFDNAGVLVLEDIDILSGSKRPGTVEARMLSLLLDCIDTNRDRVFVVGTTNCLSAIPPELKRAGRLDTTIDIHLVDAQARAAVLSKLVGNSISEEDVDRVAQKAHGYSAADLQSLCLRAFIENNHEPLEVETILQEMADVKPSNLNSLQSKIPRVWFSDIFGMDAVIQKARTMILDPLLHTERYRKMQVDPPRGALIYGPPGSGKSMLCCAVANELGINTIWVDASQMRSMVVGESEKAIADLFAQARKSTPCVLLLDHVSTALLQLTCDLI